MIKIRKNLSFEEQQLTVQTALFEGFFSESSRFPIASVDDGEEVPKTFEKLAKRYQSCLKDKTALPKDYLSATSYAKEVPDFDWRPQKGLEKLFERGTYLIDKDGDFLADQINFQFILPEDCDPSTMIAACNIAYRLGMEVTAVDDWLLTKEKEDKATLSFTQAGSPQILQAADDDILLQGTGTELVDFSNYLCENFPEISFFDKWSDYLKELTDGFLLKNVDGQLSYLASLAAEQKATAYVSPDFKIGQRLTERFPEVTFKKFTDKKKVYQKKYDFPWEVDQFNEKLATLVYPRLAKGDQLSLTGVLSENPQVRRRLQRKIEEKLDTMGISHEIEIISSHKQGFSWLAEYVIPQLKNKAIDKLTIAFKPFLADPNQAWKEEDGATPSYVNLDNNEPDKWLDLPIRYLQELYPIQDILLKELSLTEEQIEFVKYAGNEALTYKVVATDSMDQEIYQNSYQAYSSERPYLNEFPGLGKVHPASSHLLAEVNGEVLVDQRLSTDLEKIWDVYQAEILPDCKKFIEQKATPTKDEQPFFAQLKLEVLASEPDYSLESRNDLFSSLDAFHEDLYFVGQDYFKNYGMKVSGEVFERPGLILPVIKQAEGAPSICVTLYDQKAVEPKIIIDGKELSHPQERQTVALWIKKIALVAGKIEVTLGIKGVSAAAITNYCNLLAQGLVAQNYDFSEVDRLIFDDGKKEYSVKLAASRTLEKNRSIMDLDFKADEFIGYDKYIELIEQLKEVPGIAVYQTATSYLGRKIYAVELLPKSQGYVSRTKRLVNHPSEIINSRHHANENSSTNSAFMLLQKLLTDKKYADLTEDLNLVIVPLENVDGAAIHDQLQKDNPYWKLHTARFNGVGDEFYYEHFQSTPQSPEALGLTRLYESFVPDVIVDNHGVPTHEWEQPFSGYTSPSYKGFWLPRSLLYGYFWIPSNKQYRSNACLNKAIEKTIAHALEEDEEIHRWNVEWAKQFELYAHRWLPKLFPAEYYHDMINYWIEFAEDPTHRYPSIRFPWLTSVSYTSEVADETAQGDYLALCARAHLVHDLAIIDLLRQADLYYQDKLIVAKDQLSLVHSRQRPIVAKMKRSEENGMD